MAKMIQHTHLNNGFDNGESVSVIDAEQVELERGRRKKNAAKMRGPSRLFHTYSIVWNESDLYIC